MYFGSFASVCIASTVLHLVPFSFECVRACLPAMLVGRKRNIKRQIRGWVVGDAIC